MSAEKVKILKLGQPHKKEILFLESGFHFIGLKDFSFPPKDIREKIGLLPKVNYTPTNFVKRGADEILKEAQDNPIVVSISKASPQERQMLENLRERHSNIQLVDDGPEENLLLRSVCKNIASYVTEKNGAIGAIGFKTFVEELFSKHQDSVLTEWNDFIVKHETTSKATSVEDTHHFTNVGLKTKSEGADPLRSEVLRFVSDVMNIQSIRIAAEKIFHDQSRSTHDHFKSFEDFLVAIGMAEFSNFVRGGVVYRIRKGDEKFFVEKEYMPRRLAAEIMDEVSDVIEEKNK
ncbi:MAG: hypothetical protein WC744_03595 [Patescibacteria group bacterium]|jgi:hypothetical protein